MKLFVLFALLLYAAPLDAQAPQGELTLDRAIAAALERSPEVAAVRNERVAREALLRQARRLPNPRAMAEVENVETSAASQETTASISQLVELGGDRNARVREAAAAVRTAAVDLELTTLDVRGRVKAAFGEVLAAQSVLEIANESLGLVEQLAGATRERVEAGRTAGIEEVRTRVTVAAERIEVDAAETRLRIARQNLAAAIGDDAVRFERVSGDFDQIAAAGRNDRPLEQHPALRRALLVVEEREARLALEQARRIPDLDATAGYRTFEEVSDHAFVAGVGIELPVFSRNTDAVAAARARVEAAQADARAVRIRAGRDATSTRAREQAALRKVETLRNEVIPAAQEVFEAVSEGFRLGRFGYLEVVEARRTLVSSRRQLVEALEQLVEERIELEKLTGEMR